MYLNLKCLSIIVQYSFVSTTTIAESNEQELLVLITFLNNKFNAYPSLIKYAGYIKPSIVSYI